VKLVRLPAALATGIFRAAHFGRAIESVSLSTSSANDRTDLIRQFRTGPRQLNAVQPVLEQADTQSVLGQTDLPAVGRETPRLALVQRGMAIGFATEASRMHIPY
jgi:hypothetical protein